MKQGKGRVVKTHKPRLDVQMAKTNRARMRTSSSTDFNYAQNYTPRYMVTSYYDDHQTVQDWSAYRGPVVTTSGSQVTDSIKTPGWPRVKRKPDNRFRRDREFRSDPITLFQINWFIRSDLGLANPGRLAKVDFYEVNAEAFGGRLSRGAPADDPYPRLSMKILDQLQLAKTNTAVAMAELHKTASHVAKTARRLGSAYLALKRLKFRDFARELGLIDTVSVDVRKKYLAHSRKSLLSYGSSRTGAKSRIGSFAAETWLEYSYAWKPLLKDVYDHADALAQTVVERQGVMREAKAKHKTMKTETILTRGGNLWDYEFVSTDRQWQAMEVRYSIPPGTVSAVRAFGLANPLEVAWELVPFSFVADWFLPVGDAIRGLTATTGLTFHSGWRTTKALHKIASTVYANDRLYTSGSLRAVGIGRATANLWWFDIQRNQITDFPVPQFPKWKDPRSIAHGLSAIALLKSIFLDRKEVRRTLR